MAASVTGSILERDRELAAVDDALAAARDGTGSLLFVEAHAGIGKTALLRVAGERGAEAGMQVLRAQGSELEREHSFGVVLQLLEPAYARVDDCERQDLLSGAAALARPLLEGQAPAAGSPDDQLFGLLHGLYWLVSNLAERTPLVIAADDAHWTDRPSLRFFLYLAQRLRELPVVLLSGARPLEPGAPEDLLRALRSHPATERLRPAALSAPGVEALVAERMPGADPEFTSACGRVTGGNPYLLNELLADFEQRGVEPTAAQAEQVGRLAPHSVLEAAVVRLGRLPPGASEIARAVAVLSDDATLHYAAALAGLDRDAAATAVDALTAAELMKLGRPLAFVHPLLRSAIYQEISVAARGEMHRRAAGLLAEAGAADETIAAHLLSSTRSGDAWVVEELRQAAARSLARGGADSAVSYLNRALEEPPTPDLRGEVLLELGKAESLTGQADAITRLDQALELIDDRRRRADILRELGWALHKRGDVQGANAAFERGLTEVDGLPPDETTKALEVGLLQVAHLGTASQETSAGQRAERLTAEILDKPGPELAAGERGILSILAIHKLYASAPHEQVISLCEQVWGGGVLLDQEGSNSHTVWHIIGCLSWADALDLAEEVNEAAMECARREGSLVTLALGLYARSWPRYWRGDLATAAADGQAAVSAWSGEFSMYLPTAAYWLALARIDLGDLPAAEAAVDLPDAEARWADNVLYGPYLAARGVVAYAQGDIAGAAKYFEAVGDSIFGATIPNPAVIPWRSYLSASRLAMGDREGAREAVSEELELARRFGAPRPLGVALRAAGLAEDGEAGIELMEEAVATLRRSPSKLELARALIDLGAALRRAHRPAEAREPLRDGLELADRLGAVVLGRRAHEELLAAGAKPRRRELSGAASLTPSELRVAKLAASGMTNREIAQSLFVTIKAVQWHLRNAYRKLDVAGREGLRAVLEED